jgi:hypothetical protein
MWRHASEDIMRSFARLAFAGISGVVLFKLFATILFPLLGLFFGLLAMTVKLAVIAAVIFFVYSMIRKRKEDAWVEVEVED